MKRFIIWISLLLFVLTIITVSCKHDVGTVANAGTGTGGGTGGTGGGGTGGGGVVTPCDTTKIYFQQQILPVLLSNCAMSGCHDDGSHQHGVVLTSYEKVMATAHVSPGRPDNSDLYDVLTETDPNKRMPRPPRSPLTNTQITAIRKWIEQGAENLSCLNLSCDTTNVTYTAVIKPIITTNCQGCHSGTTASAGIDLSSYNGLKAKITDGRLWGAINHYSAFSPMPKNAAKLSDCNITKIRKWIEAGSPNN